MDVDLNIKFEKVNLRCTSFGVFATPKEVLLSLLFGTATKQLFFKSDEQ